MMATAMSTRIGMNKVISISAAPAVSLASDRSHRSAGLGVRLGRALAIVLFSLDEEREGAEKAHRNGARTNASR